MATVWQTIKKWVTNENQLSDASHIPDKIDWLRAVPFLLMHAGCFLVIWTGFSKVAAITALTLYFIRLFSIGAFYHRYFSHKTYQTNRFWQFIFALMGATAAQRGPLWWSSHHRQHHLCTDQPEDVHSPVQHGFWWSHVGWFLSKRNYYYKPERVKDLAAFPELVFLDRYDSLVPVLLLAVLMIVGKVLQLTAPELHTSALQMAVWGFFLSTTLLFHTTVTINSLTHIFGRQAYPTNDNSRNSFLLALLTLGEGWHNNHHYYPASVRQGFRWWQIDITFYILKLLEKLGMVWHLRGVPAAKLKRPVAHHQQVTFCHPEERSL